MAAVNQRAEEKALGVLEKLSVLLASHTQLPINALLSPNAKAQDRVVLVRSALEEALGAERLSQATQGQETAFALAQEAITAIRKSIAQAHNDAAVDVLGSLSVPIEPAREIDSTLRTEVLALAPSRSFTFDHQGYLHAGTLVGDDMKELLLGGSDRVADVKAILAQHHDHAVDELIDTVSTKTGVVSLGALANELHQQSELAKQLNILKREISIDYSKALHIFERCFATGKKDFFKVVLKDINAPNAQALLQYVFTRFEPLRNTDAYATFQAQYSKCEASINAVASLDKTLNKSAVTTIIQTTGQPYSTQSTITDLQSIVHLAEFIKSVSEKILELFENCNDETLKEFVSNVYAHAAFGQADFEDIFKAGKLANEPKQKIVDEKSVVALSRMPNIRTLTDLTQRVAFFEGKLDELGVTAKLVVRDAIEYQCLSLVDPEITRLPVRKQEIDRAKMSAKRNLQSIKQYREANPNFMDSLVSVQAASNWGGRSPIVVPSEFRACKVKLESVIRGLDEDLVRVNREIEKLGKRPNSLLWQSCKRYDDSRKPLDDEKAAKEEERKEKKMQLDRDYAQEPNLTTLNSVFSKAYKDSNSYTGECTVTKLLSDLELKLESDLKEVLTQEEQVKCSLFEEVEAKQNTDTSDLQTKYTQFMKLTAQL